MVAVEAGGHLGSVIEIEASEGRRFARSANTPPFTMKL
jgi:hypothetical protein